MRLLILLLLLPHFASTQTDWVKVEGSVFMDLIQEYERSIPAGESYSLETSYKIFNNYQDQQPVQSFESKVICRAGKELNVAQMGHLMIQDAVANITIDTAGRQILLQKADPSFFYRKTVQDYAVFLEMAEAVYTKTLNDRSVYLLQLKKGNPYHSMEFTFSDKNIISQIVIYSNRPYYNDDESFSSEKAKIVLDFKNFRKGKAVDFRSFITIRECALIKDNKITPLGTYKEFEVIDLRN